MTLRITRAAALWLGALLVLGASESVLPAQTPKIALADLWEDTPVTKDLPHSFRIYKRRQMANHLQEQLRLYLIHPRDWQAADRRPVVLFIHGGGWGAGDPDQWFPQCRYFALRGLVGASVQYRLKTGTNTVATCLSDCKSAVRYLRRHAGELGIDRDKIVVVGESAGGHLAAALGTIEQFDDPLDEATISAVPNILVLLNPITDLTTRWGEGLGQLARALSPLHHISKRTPPTLLIHGDADSVVDLRHSRLFHERMVELGNSSTLVVLPGADHAFAIAQYGPDRFARRTILELDEFLRKRGLLAGQPLIEN